MKTNKTKHKQRKQSENLLYRSNAGGCFIYGLQIFIQRTAPHIPNRHTETILMQMTRKLLFYKVSITKPFVESGTTNKNGAFGFAACSMWSINECALKFPLESSLLRLGSGKPRPNVSLDYNGHNAIVSWALIYDPL